MIGRLRGILENKKPPNLLVDVQGVGYELQAPMSTIYQLPEVGSEVVLVTHFHVREDIQFLYGFYTEKERMLFRALIKISGVGPKMALTILSGMDVSTFVHCVDQREVALLVRLPGVGQKTAERLVIEMAGKLDVSSGEGDFSRKFLVDNVESGSLKGAEEEAIGALINLGYKSPQASRLVRKIAYKGASSEELIRCALQSLAKV